MHCPVVHFLNHMPTVRMLVGAVLALHTLVRAVPQEDDLERTMRWACSSVGEQVYAEAGSPLFKEYSYVREPMETIAHFAPECDGNGLCSSVRRRLVKAFQLWDTSRENANHTATADIAQAFVHAAFDEVVGTLGLRNFLRLVRDANALSTSLTCSQSISRCRSVKDRDPLNANLRLNMHVFGRHCAEAHSEGKLSTLSRAALVHEFAGTPDLVQGLHGSVWTFTVGLLPERTKQHPIWHNGGTKLTGRTTAGSATELTAIATAIVGNVMQELCGQLDLQGVPLRAWRGPCGLLRGPLGAAARAGRWQEASLCAGATAGDDARRHRVRGGFGSDFRAAEV